MPRTKLTPEERRAKNAAYSRASYSRCRERRLANTRTYGATHREEKRAYNHEYGVRNREAICQQKREYYQTNRAKALAWMALYAVTHAAEREAYRKANLDKDAVRSSRKRARKLNAPINDFTHDQWVMLQIAQDHCCAYCGKRAKGHLTQDHILALAKGGDHTLHNIIAACAPCNSRKGTRNAPVPVQPLLL